jgi:nicotinamide riboside kinase
MAKQKKRIIITGAHGTGKTTLMNALAEDGTRTISQVDRKVVEENGWGHSENTNTECQKAIFKAIKKELSSKRNYVSDRGLTCVAGYTFSKALTEEIPKKVADKQYLDIQKFHDENPDILVVYTPIEFPLVTDGVRSADPTYQGLIDFLIKNILDTAGIPYITVHGTVEERKAQVEEELQKRG